VLLSSVAPPGSNFEDTPLQDFEWLVMHELGHTLGLGHPTNIDSIDLMGYGWIGENQPPPILSDCDVDALAFIWAWALDGTSPSPPTSGLYDCLQS